MSNNSNWKSVLQAILNEHNWRHATRHKGVSHNTASARAHILFHIFALLRALGAHLSPPHLKGWHIQMLVRFWTCNPAIADLCRQHGVPLPDRPFSPAYIQQQLSVLRVFSSWIGKPDVYCSRTGSNYYKIARCPERLRWKFTARAIEAVSLQTIIYSGDFDT